MLNTLRYSTGATRHCFGFSASLLCEFTYGFPGAFFEVTGMSVAMYGEVQLEYFRMPQRHNARIIGLERERGTRTFFNEIL